MQKLKTLTKKNSAHKCNQEAKLNFW